MIVLRELSCNWPRWEDEKCYDYWAKQIGEAQFYLPVNVINEYCRLDMSFYLRNFLELTLPRSRQFLEPKWSGQTDKHEFFEEWRLGKKVGITRGGIIIGACNSGYIKPDDYQHYADSDYKAMNELLVVRTSQRTELITSIMNTNTNAFKK